MRLFDELEEVSVRGECSDDFGAVGISGAVPPSRASIDIEGVAF